MQEVNVGIVGLGNVGSSTLAILAENGDQIALKLGYRIKVVAVCSRSVHTKKIPEGLGPVFKTVDWREVVTHPDVHIVAELVGGTQAAADVVNAAIENHKSVVTANKELMAACGPEPRLTSRPYAPMPPAPETPAIALMYQVCPGMTPDRVTLTVSP